MAPLTPADPQRLGRYWLAGRLGAGGQGVVYEAYGEAGERVAVKVPRLDDRAALGREAAAAQRVASFCTARVIEVDLDVPYIVSEYVPGPNLRQVGRYDGDALRRLAIGVATALTAIHQAGVVHRDLKPDNIIVGPDGPRVIDFGVAREVGPTTTSPVMGTPNYMAPEVWAGRGATPAADVWAWGLVMLFAACGRDAVSGQDPASVLDFVPDLTGLPDPLGRTTGPLAFSPDGKYFAVAQRDRLSLWDADLTTRLADLPAPGDSTPVSLAWSPDSRTLAAYEFGDRLRLWDVPSRQSLGVVLAGLTDPEYGVASPMAFTGDGRTLVNVSPEGTVRRFALDPAQVVEAVCRRAGRALTPAERTAYLPEAEPFDPC